MQIQIVCTKGPDQIVTLFRGLTISQPHEPGLYEVRVEKTLGKADAESIDPDKLADSMSKSIRLTRKRKNKGSENAFVYFSKQ